MDPGWVVIVGQLQAYSLTRAAGQHLYLIKKGRGGTGKRTRLKLSDNSFPKKLSLRKVVLSQNLNRRPSHGSTCQGRQAPGRPGPNVHSSVQSRPSESDSSRTWSTASL